MLISVMSPPPRIDQSAARDPLTQTAAGGAGGMAGACIAARRAAAAHLPHLLEVAAVGRVAPMIYPGNSLGISS
jgi:hypothetical protein